MRWKKARSFEKVLCETLARRTLSLVCACACACVGLKVCAHIHIYPHSQYLWLAYQVKSYTFHRGCWLLRCVCVCMCLPLYESCISCASELCGLILSRKEFPSKSSWIFSRNAAWIYSGCPKLIQTIKHVVWIEYYICYAVSISI